MGSASQNALISNGTMPEHEIIALDEQPLVEFAVRIETCERIGCAKIELRLINRDALQHVSQMRF
jgi:hypothetical protein